MDAAHSDSQQLLAAADGDKTAWSDRVSRLSDDAAFLVLPLLSLDGRARAACVRKAWRAAAAEPSLWAELDFRNCGVRFGDVEQLAALCARAGAALRTLHVDTGLCRDLNDAGAIVAALRDGSCTRVRRVFMRLGNNSPLTPALVAQLVAACPELERTSLQVSCTSFAEAAQAVALLPGPLELRVQNERASEREESLRRLLSDSVFELDLRDCRLGQAAETAALFGTLPTNDTLAWLYLSNNDVGDHGAVALGEALRVNRTLKFLYADANSISTTGALALSEALRMNKTLLLLSLTGNEIDSVGMTALAEALCLNSALQTLDIQSNHIGSDGAVALAEVLRVNETLMELGIGNNCIDDDGVDALCEALFENSTLTKLVLCCNDFGYEGVAALGAVLRVNETLWWLDAQYNDIGDDGAAALGQALRTNRSLAVLELGHSGISDQGANALGDAVLLNNTLEILKLEGNNICHRTLHRALRGLI